MQKRVDWHLSFRSWAIIDSLIALFSVICSYIILGFPLDNTPPVDLQIGVWSTIAIYIPTLIICSYIGGLYEKKRFFFKWNILLRVFLIVSASLLLILFALHFLYLKELGRMIFGFTACVTTLGMLATRRIIWSIYKSSKRRILLVMNTPACKLVKKDISSSPIISYQLIELPENKLNGDILSFCQDKKIEEIIIDSCTKETPERSSFWWKCMLEGINITNVVFFYEKYFLKIPVSLINPAWMIQLDLKLLHPFYHRLKRFLDILYSITGLIFTAPIFLLIALAIRLEDKGNVLFRQTRVGLRGKPFVIYKFRTMSPHKHQAEDRWTKKGDHRITLVGRVLRKTRLDELPQLLNILRGDMSFIGPRPEWDEIAKEWEQKVPLYCYRCLVKPGLTGWAQINYRYASSQKELEEKLAYDFYYIKNMSFALDFQILLRTVGVVTKGAL